ncbi:TetR/AcrR family transcriptional regulator [Halalkalicoccus subterraneus]|uniref:TetR/AcrR family transcriptional regulator n=1 Tax=Halalkalicoccus subterraneus TaxID=2675002 RepID=UPI0013CE3F81|nr:TetR/AcrR family transcriptional regulator [Halalkalicoccus subterraneus]
MQATARALCELGYSRLRVRDIDEYFGKSRQLINHYYDGKDDLIEAVLTYLLAEYERGIAVGDDVSPEQQLHSYIQQFFYGPDIEDFDHWAFVTALIELRSQAQHYPRHQKLLSENYFHLRGILIAIIETGIEQGDFQDVDADIFATAIIHIISTSRMRKVCLGDGEAIEDGRKILDTIIFPQLINVSD